MEAINEILTAKIAINLGMWFILLGLLGFGVYQLIQIENLLKKWLIKQDNLNLSGQKITGFMESIKIYLEQKE